MKSVKKTALLSAVAALSLVPSAASAADAGWAGLGLSSNFTDPTNWQGFFVPGAGDRAVFSNGLPANQPVFGTGTVTINQLLISSNVTGGWIFDGDGGGENLRVLTDVALVDVGLGSPFLTTDGLDVFTPLTSVTNNTKLIVGGTSTYTSRIDLSGNGSFTVNSGNTLRGVVDHQSTSTSFVSGLLDTPATQIVNGGILGIAPSGHIFLNGGNHTISSGILGFSAGGAMTFDAGAVLRVQSSGLLDFQGSHAFEDGAILNVTAGGDVTGASFIDLGNGVTGSMTVDGAGSTISAPDSTDWGTGAAGVATITLSNSGAGTYQSLRLGLSSGRADVQLLSSSQLTSTTSLSVGPSSGTTSLARITVAGGTLNNGGPATFRNGGQLVMTSGGVNFTGDGTFAAGSTFNTSGGNVTIASGRTFNLAGGVVNRTGASGWSSLSNGATLRITAGTFTTNNFFDVANGVATGMMIVDGATARFNSTSGVTDWGQQVGNFATITFANGGVGTYSGGLQIADGGGRALVNLNSNAQLNAAALVVGGAASVATINISGGTLNALSTANFNNGALVNLTSGGLNLNGNATFNTGATLNRTGGNLTLAPGQTLAFAGGVGSLIGSFALPNGSTLRVTNGGRFQTTSFFDVANGAATGTLAVDGANSRVIAGDISDWGGSTGNTATVTFSNSGAGTYNSLRLSRFGGTTNFSLSTNATLTATNFEAGSTGATAVIQVNGGTLNATSQAIFDNGANVSTANDGVLRLGGNSSFFTGATFNGTSSAGNSGLQWADNTVLSFDGGAGTIAAIGSGIPNNGSLRITNGGSFTAVENFNMGNGTLLVSGANSKLIVNNTTSGTNFWDSGTKTVEFINGGAGTLSGFFRFAVLGGTGTLNVNGGSLRALNGFSLATNGTATVNISGGGLIETTGMSLAQGGTVTMNVNSGTLHTINDLEIAAGGTATINVNSGGTVAADGGFFTTFSGGGNATINVNGGTLRTTGDSQVNGGATINYASGTVNIGGTLGVGIENPNARVLLTPGGDKVLRVGGLSIPAANGGKVDLSDNDMIIDYTGASPLGTIRGFLGTGRNGGDWLGNGLTSSAAAGSLSTALGLVEATQIGSPATFFGQPIDNTTLLSRYTLYGDGNLDGTVDIGDFAFLASNFNVATNSWFLGDYTYDGITDIGDFALLAANFNRSLPAELPRGAAVPEPACGVAGLVISLLLAPRSRKRQK